MGSTGVLFGAFAAHTLKSKLETGKINLEQIAAFDTASKYQLLHSILLFAIAIYGKSENCKWLKRAFNSIFSGIILFSFSIYFLSTRGLMGIENLKWLGPITPLGGLLLILGWIFLSLHSLTIDQIKIDPKENSK